MKQTKTLKVWEQPIDNFCLHTRWTLNSLSGALEAKKSTLASIIDDTELKDYIKESLVAKWQGKIQALEEAITIVKIYSADKDRLF